jgi:hypothetical protein
MLYKKTVILVIRRSGKILQSITYTPPNIVIYTYSTVRVHKSRSPFARSRLILKNGGEYLCEFSTELASCHSSGAWNFEVALDFWEMCANLEYGDVGTKYTPRLIIIQFRSPSRFYA